MRQLSWLIIALIATVLPAGAEVINIGNDELATLIANGVPLIDVRTPPEWQDTGIIAGSHLLMFFDKRGGYDSEQWLNGLSAIARPEQPVILICRSGNRTTTISTFLDQQVGFTRIYNVKRGINGWIADHRPVAQKPQKSASP